MNAKDAFALAEHKARYTHKDWIVYKKRRILRRGRQRRLSQAMPSSVGHAG